MGYSYRLSIDQSIDNEMTVTWIYEVSPRMFPSVRIMSPDVSIDSVSIELISNALDDPTIRWEYQKWVWGAPARLARRLWKQLQAVSIDHKQEKRN